MKHQLQTCMHRVSCVCWWQRCPDKQYNVRQYLIGEVLDPALRGIMMLLEGVLLSGERVDRLLGTVLRAGQLLLKLLHIQAGSISRCMSLSHAAKDWSLAHGMAMSMGFAI